jgi:hypothetical protein
MTTSNQPHAYDPLTPAEQLESEASVAGLAAGEALRGVEIAAVVLLGLLICPPLAILAAVVLVPLLAMALVLGLIAAILSVPYLLVHHFRGHHSGHGAMVKQRLRHAGRALVDLLPHRIVADVRKTHAAR